MPLANPELTEFTTQPPFTTVVNFTDIIQNLGFIELFGATVHDGTNKIYILTSNSSMYSFEERTSKGPPAGTVLNNVDFPITFGNFFDIFGDALITIPIYLTSGSNNTYTVTVTLTLTTPTGDTVLGTATAAITGITGTMSALFQMVTITLEDLDFRINVGDIITLKVNAVTTGAGSPTQFVMHDPANRTTSGNINSQMKVQLPVKVDR